ncbi:arsenite efflux ATP-binding protein ArsA (TC 3.A.4.1.1) [Melghirimyces thermohalophilus]|uniref:Arsenite efflux ATP-binding protein ArsA (TC 3.A.4.1.1) n=1 Tax=Melghirimyces thermohalophilus TaxID=1236220 RepID=A0A1G6NSC4_9BACL|nr:ArsA family ATPase [Melghirimyces thermohalophilus]SDC70870.1 arsenite efflux ATP-binding protein ArsA (TC 3.A.4.1.1) [Melghirimyces thermohalophilus]
MLLSRLGGKTGRRQAEHRGEKIAFFGGKGGVGKTTCSAAYAVALASQGYRTLLVSTDPAHSVGDLLEVKAEADPVQVREQLWVREIDPEKASRRYIGEVKGNLKGLADPGLWKEVERQMDFAAASPGADEAALFDEMVSVILSAESQFDRIVFDTAPTGHTLRLLSLPELMGVWVEGMLARRKKTRELHRMLHNVAGVSEEPKDQVQELLERRKNRFASARERLLNPEVTSFYFVLNPERLSILESAKAMALLEKYEVPVGGVIVNRVLPREADGDFLARRRQGEKIYLEEIARRFADLPRTQIPLQPEDIRGLPGVKAIADRLVRNRFGGL